MERVVMLCEDVRRALPLSGTSPGERDARNHAEGCAQCAEVLRAYDADARALKAFAKGREMPTVMDGFADALMARLAEEPAVATTAPRGEIIRPDFNRVGVFLAAAAVLMLTVSLGLALGSRDSARDPAGFAVAPTPTEDVTPETPVAVVPGEGLAAPRRRDSAPTPTLVRRRGVAMPAGGGARRGMGSSSLFDALRDLQRVFPNWDPSGMDRRVPQLRSGEREVRF